MKTSNSQEDISPNKQRKAMLWAGIFVAFVVLVDCLVLLNISHFCYNYLTVENINLKNGSISNQCNNCGHEAQLHETERNGAIKRKTIAISDYGYINTNVSINAGSDYKSKSKAKQASRQLSSSKSLYDDDYIEIDDDSTMPMENDDSKRDRRLPQCIIIGVRKSGTMALLTFLNLHPDIVTASKEIHFFGNDQLYAKGLAYYKNRMPLSTTSQITIEKTPAYFREANAPERIHKMNSTIKLLLIVREPVNRLLSGYAMKRTKARKANQTYPPLKSLVLDNHGNIKESYSALLFSTYHFFFTNWLQYFSLKQIHVVDGEKLVKDPVSELKQIETFLSLRHELTNENFGYSDSKGFFCKKVNSTLNCLSKTKGRPHPKVGQAVLDKLKEYFRPKNEQFFKLIGKRFNWN